MSKDKNRIFRKLRKHLKKRLTKSRYEHTLGVEYISAALAMRYGAGLYEAELAGLMHDCAKGKHLYASEMLKLCRQYQLEISETEENDPYLLHGKLGAYLCEHKYKIKNPEILSAITWHTTGRPDMTLLEKIVFIADYIEPRRDRAPDLDYLRRLAFEDIDEAVYEITRNTLDYLEKKGAASIDNITRETCEFYQKIHDSKITMNNKTCADDMPETGTITKIIKKKEKE